MLCSFQGGRGSFWVLLEMKKKGDHLGSYFTTYASCTEFQEKTILKMLSSDMNPQSLYYF